MISSVLGEPMTGGAIGEVVKSRDPSFEPGDIVLHMAGWRDEVVPHEFNHRNFVGGRERDARASRLMLRSDMIPRISRKDVNPPPGGPADGFVQ